MATFTPDDLIFTLSKESNYQSAQTVGISAAMQNGAPYEAVDIELHEAIPRLCLPKQECPSHLHRSSNDTGVPLLPNDNDRLSTIQRQRHTYQRMPTDTPDLPDLLPNDRPPYQRLITNDSDTLVLPGERAARKQRYKFKSWKVGVAGAALLCTAVLLTNLTVTIWAGLHFGQQDGIGTAYVGSCDMVTSWNFWLHIFINVLGSAILSASNYTMQCVTSPTRKECDRAHACGDWLDIGIPSVRNLSRIRWQRRWLWALLALSSVPIHLLFNAAVFKTLDRNDYRVIQAKANYLENSSSVEFSPESELYDDAWKSRARTVQDAYFANRSSFVRMSPEECITTYAIPFLSGHAHIILITSETSVETNTTLPDTSDTVFSIGDLTYKWICGQQTWDSNNTACNTIAEARAQSNGWARELKYFEMPINATVDYCLSQTVAAHCKLQFSTYILISVVVCNAVKSFAMLWTLWRHRETTFVTFGDAISSWLDDADNASKNCCIIDRRHVISSLKAKFQVAPQAASLKPSRWVKAVSRTRWVATMCIAATTVLGTSICFSSTMSELAALTAETIISLGFGNADPRMLLGNDLSLPQSILLANSPQVILSFVYLSLNSLLTAMHMACEYNRYQTRHNTLRVTTPHGHQRRTYWLQLPFRYGIPLVVISAVLHWLISQAVFLVRFEIYGISRTTEMLQIVSRVGISPAPMLLVLILCLCMVAATFAIGGRELKGYGMPVAGSCSFALAAASHRPDGDVDAAVLPVRWGEVEEMGNDDVGHCCFTSQQVVDIVHGRMYAGNRRERFGEREVEDDGLVHGVKG